jgi:hypothetical protein
MRKPAKEPATAPGSPPKLVAEFTKAPDSDKGEALARLVIHPAANAAVVMKQFCSPFGEQDLSSLVTALSEATGQIEAGNLAPVEAMLFNQAHTLQASNSPTSTVIDGRSVQMSTRGRSKPNPTRHV